MRKIPTFWKLGRPSIVRSINVLEIMLVRYNKHSGTCTRRRVAKAPSDIQFH